MPYCDILILQFGRYYLKQLDFASDYFSLCLYILIKDNSGLLQLGSYYYFVVLAIISVSNNILESGNTAKDREMSKD